MSSFKDAVLNTVKTIPKGKVVSYGQVALMVGSPQAARQVGWVLHAHGDLVPWWRVINNAGKITVKNPKYLPSMQKKLLEKEGIEVSKSFQINIKKYRWGP